MQSDSGFESDSQPVPMVPNPCRLCIKTGLDGNHDWKTCVRREGVLNAVFQRPSNHQASPSPPQFPVDALHVSNPQTTICENKMSGFVQVSDHGDAKCQDVNQAFRAWQNGVEEHMNFSAEELRGMARIQEKTFADLEGLAKRVELLEKEHLQKMENRIREAIFAELQSLTVPSFMQSVTTTFSKLQSQIEALQISVCELQDNQKVLQRQQEQQQQHAERERARHADELKTLQTKFFECCGFQNDLQQRFL